MKKKEKEPKSLADFKGKLTRVKVDREPKDEADIIATNALIQQYTDKDGFHCPRCPFTTTNREEAVNHLAEEINKTLDWLGKRRK
ncbi:hypothetical protein ES708_05179 [subsurface metagenome]